MKSTPVSRHFMAHAIGCKRAPPKHMTATHRASKVNRVYQGVTVLSLLCTFGLGTDEWTRDLSMHACMTAKPWSSVNELKENSGSSILDITPRGDIGVYPFKKKGCFITKLEHFPLGCMADNDLFPLRGYHCLLAIARKQWYPLWSEVIISQIHT